MPQEAIVAQFVTDFLGADCWTRPEFEFVADLLKRADRGLTFPPGATGAVAEALRDLDHRRPAERSLDLLGILVVLARLPARPLTGRDYRPDLDKVTRDRIDVARRYVSEHFAEHLSRNR